MYPEFVKMKYLFLIIISIFLVTACKGQQPIVLGERVTTDFETGTLISNQSFLSADPASVQNISLASGNAPFKIEVFEKNTYLIISTTISNELNAAFTMPTRAGNYKLRITDATGVMSWMDLVSNFGSGAYTTAGLTNPGGRTLIQAVGDYNGDGNLDYSAIRHTGGYDAKLFLGNGDGTYTLDQNIADDIIYPRFIDLHADGDLDLIYVKYITGEFCYRFNNGVGVFAAEVCLVMPVPSSGAAQYRRAQPVFLNDDKYPDVVINGVTGQGIIFTAIGKADGSFEAPVEFDPAGGLVTTSSQRAMTMRDMNDDGYEDVIMETRANVANELQTTFYIADGAGSFSSAYQYRDTSSVAMKYMEETKGPCVIDTNGDNLPDLLSSILGFGFTSHTNNGDGTFNLQTTIPKATSEDARGFACSDLDGDGTLDIVSANYNRYLSGGNYQGFQISTGNADGSLNAKIYMNSKYVYSNWQRGTMSLGDFNNDGRIDILHGAWENGATLIMLGQP